MSTYYGMVKHNTVVFPDLVQLAEGLRVQVKLLPLQGRSESTEEQFERQLLELGLLTEIKSETTSFDERTPAQIAGKTLSELILEERR
jgi:hypothetical protein